MGASNYDATANLDDGSCIEDIIVKIGFLNPITGGISQFAPAFTYAAAAAASDLNTNNDGYTFEIVTADSGCDGTVAAAAAQTLIDAGVVAVAGAACSGASMAANAVLSAAGVPMISYASTSPSLNSVLGKILVGFPVPIRAVREMTTKPFLLSWEIW